MKYPSSQSKTRKEGSHVTDLIMILRILNCYFGLGFLATWSSQTESSYPNNPSLRSGYILAIDKCFPVFGKQSLSTCTCIYVPMYTVHVYILDHEILHVCMYYTCSCIIHPISKIRLELLSHAGNLFTGNICTIIAILYTAVSSKSNKQGGGGGSHRLLIG